MADEDFNVTQPPPEIVGEGALPAAPSVIAQLQEPVAQAEQPQQAPDIGTQPMVMPQPAVSQPPPRPPGTSSLGGYQGTKGQIFRNMLGDFLYSAGKGLAAAGHGPEANARGAGEAVTAIHERGIQQQQLALQAQQVQAMQAYHQAQAAALTGGAETIQVPIIGPDGKAATNPDGSVQTQPILKKDLGNYFGRTGAAALRGAATQGAASTAATSREAVADKLAASRQSVAEINAAVKAGKEPTDPIYTITKQLYPELDPKSKEFAQKWEEWRMKEKTDPGVKRMVEYAYTKASVTPFETQIPGTNTPTTMSQLQAVQTGAPKVPLATQAKLGGQYALFNDAYGILDKVSELADKVNMDDKAVASRVAAGYAAIKDPAAGGLTGEALSNILFRQPINNQLSDDERSLVLTMAQGKAAGTGFRGIMGQAGTNELQQRLDSALMPGPQGGSKKAVKAQVNAARALLDRFVVGQPNVGLNAPGTPTALVNKKTGGAPKTGPLSLDEAMDYLRKAGGNKAAAIAAAKANGRTF